MSALVVAWNAFRLTVVKLERATVDIGLMQPERSAVSPTRHQAAGQGNVSSDRDWLALLSQRTAEWAVSLPPHRVLSEAVSFLAARFSPELVAGSLVETSGLEVTWWPVRDGILGEERSSWVDVDAYLGLATAARRGDVVFLRGGEARSRGLDDGSRSVLAIPLIAGRDVVGAVGLETALPDGFDIDPVLAGAVGCQLGLAVAHSRSVDGLERSLRQTVTVLSAMVEQRDAYTEAHCVHLAEMALAVGVRMGLGASVLDRLTYGGLLHDVGKITLPDAVLLKPEPLDSAEFAQMKTHASVGEEVLERIDFLREVAPIVGQHHERFDGAGYPRGLRGEQILLEARILAVVDAFDAMISTRPYRAALSWHEAVAEIQAGAGTQFDPEIAEVFLRYLEGEEAQWKTPEGN